MSASTHPRIGVGVFITRKDESGAVEFIMGLRHGSTGSGTWALPGGHLEFGESFDQCAAREVEEETGLKITGLRFLTATNDIMTAENKHYVTIFMVCERADHLREPQLREPDKCLGWRWVKWSDMTAWADEQVKRESQQGPDDERSTDNSKSHTLFSPMIALVQQRPGVIPSLS